MIYLDNQYSYHKGIMVLPDYSNPNLFYYLPPSPELVEDPETGRKVFKIIKFAGGLTDPTDPEGIRTGVLLFDCDLGLSDDELSDLKEAVQMEHGTGDGTQAEISLVPLLYKEGAVSCYVLGKQDWSDDDVEEGQSSNIFMEKLSSFGTPSLYGDNRASFSARMTPEGVTALEASMEGGGAIGISVVYTLKFDALRPAFTFKVRADWDRVYHFLQETYKADLFFFSYEETSILEQLEEEQLVTFEEVVYEEGAKNELRDLRKQMQKYLLETFFEPVLSVGDPATGRVPGLVQDILRATIVVPTVGYKRVELTQEERKSLSFDLTQTTSIGQTIYPQAHLKAMIPADEIPSYVQEINSDQDLFFRQLDVECTLGGADFDQHQIAWVHPFVRYGAEPEEGMDKTLREAADQMHFNTWIQPDHGFAYRTWYEVAFQPIDPTDPNAIFAKEGRYISQPEERTDRSLVIDPLEQFRTQTYEFELLDGFPTDKYPAVEAELRYRDSEGYELNAGFLLKSGDDRKQAVRVRTLRGTTVDAQYRLVYHRDQGGPIPKDWAPLTKNHVLVQHPFPSFFTVGVRMAELPNEFGWADITLRYADPDAAGSEQEERIFFTTSDLTDPIRMNRNWTIRTTNPERQRYKYMFTIFYLDGTMLQSPGWIESDARTLALGRRIRSFRTVTVRPDGPPFAEVNLRDIQVKLQNGGQEPVELRFEDEQQQADFSYQFFSPDQVGYTYEILYRWRNGQFKRVQGTSPNGSLDLLIPTEG